MRHPRLALGLSLAGLALLLTGLTQGAGPVPPLGALLDPLDGVFGHARRTAGDSTRGAATVVLRGLDGETTVLRDERGVPHIFAASDRDAVRALGYVVAQDRLFQLDFIPRVGAGRLAEAMGPSAAETDGFLRSTGMAWGAERNLERIRAENGVEWRMLNDYADGVNAYLATLRPADYPFEMRLLGYAPERWSPIKSLLLLQYMSYDLSFSSDDASAAVLNARLGAAYDTLYPTVQPYAIPIVPAGEAFEDVRVRPGADERAPVGPGAGQGTAAAGARRAPRPSARESAPLAALRAGHERLAGTLGEGFVHGKGSNNWAVSGARSTTGAPILAGDMHLALSLPAIWYEVHVVTPTMNVYGVTIPGAPIPVEAFNDHLGWTFTNTGSDQIDHYRLELDASGTRYRHNGAWRPLDIRPDTIRVNGGAPVIGTLRYSHFGPVVVEDGQAVALRWTAHEPSRTLAAAWAMAHATDYASFEAATRQWDTPMQNILYAGRDGVVAIRSTGHLPLRRSGSGAGLLDGTSDRDAWQGRIPFDLLPHAVSPARGYLSSTNQMLAGPAYPYYTGYDWREVFRSLRIDALLAGKPKHSVDDLKRYQSDVRAGQADWVRTLVAPLDGLSPRAQTVRDRLVAWDGEATVDRAEPLALHFLLRTLTDLAWDEPAFEDQNEPAEAQLLGLLRDAPALRFWDVARTPAREDAPALLRLALAATADTLARRYGPNDAWTRERWGDHHRVVFRHLTRADALGALWRGPFPYPGFGSTLSPASSLRTTHSASWRVVVDMSQSPVVGYGVYPGGQSGDPASDLYDAHLPTYLGFRHYALYKPASAGAFDAARVRSRLTLAPAR